MNTIAYINESFRLAKSALAYSIQLVIQGNEFNASLRKFGKVMSRMQRAPMTPEQVARLRRTLEITDAWWAERNRRAS